MQCNISNNKMNSRHKKTHQELPRFNHNLWSTSSPQDLLEVFFHYAITNYRVGADLSSAQLAFTQELLPSSTKWFCPRPTSTYKCFAYTREHSNSHSQVYISYTSEIQTLYIE